MSTRQGLAAPINLGANHFREEQEMASVSSCGYRGSCSFACLYLRRLSAWLSLLCITWRPNIVTVAARDPESVFRTCNYPHSEFDPVAVLVLPMRHSLAGHVNDIISVRINTLFKVSRAIFKEKTAVENQLAIVLLYQCAGRGFPGQRSQYWTCL